MNASDPHDIECLCEECWRAERRCRKVSGILDDCPMPSYEEWAKKIRDVRKVNNGS